MEGNYRYRTENFAHGRINVMHSKPIDISVEEE
jgi:hypothetical protein